MYEIELRFDKFSNENKINVRYPMNYDIIISKRRQRKTISIWRIREMDIPNSYQIFCLFCE
ncbi:MAG: hypothetical protein EA341_17870 [Mongoliibacter sp.]|nr:MAG: hypothetical protein EA341_17870 [Mongoliibacter sp.]